MSVNFPSPPERFANDPEIVAEHRRQALEAINRTIKMSEICCVTFDNLLARIERLWDDPDAGQIVYRVCNETLSENQCYALAESIRRLANAVDLLPSVQKASPDRAIKRMLVSMPAEIAVSVAEQWLEHKRKFRREIAYRLLRECDLTAASGARLLDVFSRTRDQECLRLLARSPAAIENMDIQPILENMDDYYWRMRLVQAALISNKTHAMALADSYPYEVLHSIGRLRDATVLPKLADLFATHSHDLQFVSLYAWVLGQLGAYTELLTLKAHVEKLG